MVQNVRVEPFGRILAAIWRPYGGHQVARVDETDLNRFNHASQSSRLFGDSTEMLVFLSFLIRILARSRHGVFEATILLQWVEPP